MDLLSPAVNRVGSGFCIMLPVLGLRACTWFVPKPLLLRHCLPPTWLPEHSLIGPYCPLTGLLDSCFAGLITVQPTPSLWAVFSWTVHDGQCWLEWGAANFLPFNHCPLLISWNLPSIRTAWSVFHTWAPQWMRPLPVSRQFLLLPHSRSKQWMAITSWDRIFA